MTLPPKCVPVFNVFFSAQGLWQTAGGTLWLYFNTGFILGTAAKDQTNSLSSPTPTGEH